MIGGDDRHRLALIPDLAERQHRLVVMLDWLWSYVTFESGARLITGSDPPSLDRPSL